MGDKNGQYSTEHDLVSWNAMSSVDPVATDLQWLWYLLYVKCLCVLSYLSPVVEIWVILAGMFNMSTKFFAHPPDTLLAERGSDDETFAAILSAFPVVRTKLGVYKNFPIHDILIYVNFFRFICRKIIPRPRKFLR